VYAVSAFPWFKRSEREANHRLTFVLKNQWNYTHTPSHAFIAYTVTVLPLRLWR